MAGTEQTPVSPVGFNKPEISVSAATINNEPVELDSTPTSPEELRKRRGSKEDISPEQKEKRELLIHHRQTDPAVVVDVPATPGAEEFGKSEDAEGKLSKGESSVGSGVAGKSS